MRSRPPARASKRSPARARPASRDKVDPSAGAPISISQIHRDSSTSKRPEAPPQGPLRGPIVLRLDRAEPFHELRRSAKIVTRDLLDGEAAFHGEYREIVPNDRRSIRIAVTQQGREALARDRKTRLRHLADRLERLGDSEQRALQRGVELLERVTIRG